MENNVIISVNNVSMCFNMATERYDNFKEYFIRMLKNQISYNKFWALKNITFDICKGESIGFIGLNGSGKSTLLKTIAGVLKPTEGNVSVYGTIAPLIELGAGFDYELTAKENIFLNGALLGYPKNLMEDYYDDIVEFSELNDFMNVPVKNFSSGMMSRLAFAIATVGKPDILICDEVLSVGDFRFQEKCHNRIKNMMDQGTTVLFVSHSIDDVKKICTKVVWLEHGNLKKIGNSLEICDEYCKEY